MTLRRMKKKAAPRNLKQWTRPVLGHLKLEHLPLTGVVRRQDLLPQTLVLPRSHLY